MLKAMLTIAFLVGLLASPCSGKECGDCSLETPCDYVVSDGFNTAYSLAWCDNAQWYTGRFGHHTALGYIKIYKIANPFREKEYVAD